MLDRRDLEDFEKVLSNVADEITILSEKGESFRSVFDDSAKTSMQSKLGNILKSALEEEEREKMDAPSGKFDGEIDDAVDTAEAFSLPDEVADGETIAKDVVDIDSDVPTEVIEDNIEDIEQLSQEDIKEDYVEYEEGFFLPIQYKTMDREVSSSTEAVPSDAAGTDIDDQGQDADLDTIISAIGDTDMEYGDAESPSALDKEIKEFEAAYGGYEDSAIEHHATIDFTKDDEEIFLTNLSTYSIFIRKSVAVIIGDEELQPIAEQIIALVLEAAPAQQIQRECEKVLNYNIDIPTDTRIYSSEALSKKLFSMRDVVIRVSSRVFTKTTLVSASAVAVLLLIYLFGIQPLRAWWYYRQGYEALQSKDYEESEAYFVHGVTILPWDSMYFKYAEEYTTQKMYAEAERKYIQLVFGLNDTLHQYLLSQALKFDIYKQVMINGKYRTLVDIIYFSPEGFKRLASFNHHVKGDYERAIIFYTLLLNIFPQDTDVQIGMANTYIDRFDSSQDDWYLHQAKELYNEAIHTSGGSDVAYVSSLLWAVRSNEPGAKQYIEKLFFILRELSDEVDELLLYRPYIAMARYNLDNNKPDNIAEILDLIDRIYPTSPEVAYLFSRYYLQTGQLESARNALLHAYHEYNQAQTLHGISLNDAIDTKILLGEFELEHNNNLVLANRYLSDAQIQYEKSLHVAFIESNPHLARLYYLQSKLELKKKNIVRSTQLLEKAVEHGYMSYELQYQRGVLRYLNQDWKQASRDFLDLLRQGADSNEKKSSILLAAGNTLMMQNNYAAAVAQYRHALTILLDSKINQDYRISYISIKKDEYLLALFERTAYVKNNLGVALYYLSRQRGYSSSYASEAMAELRVASTMLQNRNRDPFTDVRTSYQELPHANLAFLLGESKVPPMNIYTMIPTHIDSSSRWWRTLAAR